MKSEWAEICNRYVGALFSYTHNINLYMITRVREVDGVLEFIYHKMQMDGEHVTGCRYFLDRRDVIWYRAPSFTYAERQKWYLKCSVKNLDNSAPSIKVK